MCDAPGGAPGASCLRRRSACSRGHPTNRIIGPTPTEEELWLTVRRRWRNSCRGECPRGTMTWRSSGVAWPGCRWGCSSSAPARTPASWWRRNGSTRARGGVQGRGVECRERRPLLPRGARDARSSRRAPDQKARACASSFPPATTATSPSGWSSARQLIMPRSRTRSTAGASRTSCSTAASRHGADAVRGFRVQDVELGEDEHTVVLGTTTARRPSPPAGWWTRPAAATSCCASSSASAPRPATTSTPPGFGSPAAWTSRTGPTTRSGSGGARARPALYSTTHLIERGLLALADPARVGPDQHRRLRRSALSSLRGDQHLRGVMQWMTEHEPQLAAEVDGRRERGAGLPRDRGLLLRLQPRLLAPTAGRWSARRRDSSTRSTRPARTSSATPTPSAAS